MTRDLSDPGVAARIQRHRDYWWNQEPAGAGRPLYQVVKAYAMSDTANPHELEPPPLLDAAAFRTSIEQSYDQHGLYNDDLFRLVYTGISSEVLVGCRIAVRAGTHWAEPCFTDWHQLDGYRVQDTLWYQRLLENTRRAVAALGDEKYPFCCMPFRGAADMAAAMLTAEFLCDAVLDQPAKLKDLLARITDITIETALAHGALLPRHEGGQFNSYGIWTPGRTVTFTVDAATYFSPACYEDIFLPFDQRLCAALETPFVHTHASARQHFAGWLEIPNLGLQCVIDQAYLPEGANQPIGPQLAELLEDFQTIRRRKSLMMYGYWDEPTIQLALEQLPAGGCAILGMVEDPAAIREKYLGRAA
ncbi:MAG: hypothetical protein IT369_06660 [Candidatus Latescibacteria bacterium]|nr:hypothetical protein [Candidatus Latescibacterota bacterium]